MEELKQYIQNMLNDEVIKFIISNPKNKKELFKKIIIEKKEQGFQISKYQEKLVFHENISNEKILNRICELVFQNYLQVNGFKNNIEYILLISKNGNCHFKMKKNDLIFNKQCEEHNRKKNYILEEGTIIEPLIDMGIFTKDGKIINAMYDKYKQINRFIEIIDDTIKSQNLKSLNVIDFGCGKSYLTFIIYYYLTQIKKIDAHIIGLDLKEDVIKKCNEAAKKYHYDNLKFYLGNINGFKSPFDVDMVITLHACDTATDYALYNAISWNAKMIFSVPCCQHELNQQCKPNTLNIISNYGIIKERLSALFTDAIRGNLLEYSGYKTQLLEFIDFEHTPKNILIRAIKRPITSKQLRLEKLNEIKSLINEFNFKPTLYKLLVKEEEEEKISF